MTQGRISAPLSIGLVANYLLSVISLSFVGHLGTAELAAAALATTLYSMSAKIMWVARLHPVHLHATSTECNGVEGWRNRPPLAWTLDRMGLKRVSCAACRCVGWRACWVRWTLTPPRRSALAIMARWAACSSR